MASMLVQDIMGYSLDHADFLYTMIGIIDCYTYKHKLMCNLANKVVSNEFNEILKGSHTVFILF